MGVIPKLIHYCWFGKKPHDNEMIHCMNSWKEKLTDYEIIEWNEDNFDINTNNFVKEAYENEKYAFVSDYVRLYALYKYGGVYLDTDVEILKALDDFLNFEAFLGFEDEKSISTAIIGSSKENIWVKELLEYYEGKNFIKEDGSLDTTTNVEILSRILKEKYNIELNNKLQKLPGLLTIYPREYFCPKDFNTGKLLISENTFAIHHFNGSWLDENFSKHIKGNHRIYRIFGEKIGSRVIYTKKIYKKEGLMPLINIILKKLNTKV